MTHIHTTHPHTHHNHDTSTPLVSLIHSGLGYFRLSRRHGFWPGLARVGKALLGLSNVCTTPDNAAYDMTVHAALKINKARRVESSHTLPAACMHGRHSLCRHHSIWTGTGA